MEFVNSFGNGTYRLYFIHDYNTNGQIYNSNTIDEMWKNRHQFYLNKSKMYIDGNLVNELIEEDKICTTNCFLFAMSGNRFSTRTSQKLYNVKLYDENDIMVRNFIPCYTNTTVIDVNGRERQKDTIGMYDLVNGQFYVNNGSGIFKKGNDV